MIRTLHLSHELRARIAGAARDAFPGECCGIIEGVLNGDAAYAGALHAVRNLAAQKDRFEIDPAEHIRLLRAAREKGRALIGCYHSHPGGRAEPSDTDLRGAGEEHFLWLIAALDDEDCTLRAFVFAGRAFLPVRLEAGSLEMGPLEAGARAKV